LNLVVVLSLAVCGHAEDFAVCITAEAGIFPLSKKTSGILAGACCVLLVGSYALGFDLGPVSVWSVKTRDLCTVANAKGSSAHLCTVANAKGSSAQVGRCWTLGLAKVFKL
jgi:hypothetical protein